MRALILGRDVVQLEESEFEVAPPLFWVECPNYVAVGYQYNDRTQEFYEKEQPVRSAQETMYIYQQSIDTHINQKASEKGYLSAVSCVSYINSKNPQWAIEAKAFSGWRDDVYEYVIEFHRQVEAREIALKPIPDLIALLPKFEWPTIE